LDKPSAKEYENKLATMVVTKFNRHELVKENTNATLSTLWRKEWDKVDHMYQLIRGAPAVLVRNGTPTNTIDFIPKSYLIEPKEIFIAWVKNTKN
jgi:hypothetical protein